MYESTTFLFDPPSKSTRSRPGTPSGLRSLKAKAHRYSFIKHPNGSKDSLLSDLFGLKSRPTPIELDDSQESKFSSSSSIASTSSDSTVSSAPSNTSVGTTSSSIASLTEHELFGTKARPSKESQRPQTPTAVKLAGQAYQVPEPIDKQFYRDLTFMEDEELIKKYGLIKVGVHQNAGEGTAENEEKENEKP